MVETKKTNPGVRKMLKVKSGNIQLTLATKMGAQEILRNVAKVLEPIVSMYLGGVPVTKKVLACKHLKSNKYRVVFGVEPGVKGVEVFDVFPDDRDKETRIWGLPIRLISSKAGAFLENFKEYYHQAKLDGRTGDMLLRFVLRDEKEASKLRDLAKGEGLIVRPPEKPRSGNLQPGFYIVVPVCSLLDETSPTKNNVVSINTVATSPRKSAGGKVAHPQKAAHHHLDPERVKNFLSEGINLLSEDEKISLLSLAARELSREGEITLLGKILPKGVGMYDKNQPFRPEGSGMVVNSISLEDTTT